MGLCKFESPMRYSAVKQLATDYQKAKAQVTTALLTAGCGHWIEKPVEQDQFSLQGDPKISTFSQKFSLPTTFQKICQNLAVSCGLRILNCPVDSWRPILLFRISYICWYFEISHLNLILEKYFLIIIYCDVRLCLCFGNLDTVFKMKTMKRLAFYPFTKSAIMLQHCDHCLVCLICQKRNTYLRSLSKNGFDLLSVLCLREYIYKIRARIQQKDSCGKWFFVGSTVTSDPAKLQA